MNPHMIHEESSKLALRRLQGRALGVPKPDPARAVDFRRYSVISGEGITILSNATHDDAITTARFYRNLHGGQYNIIETFSVFGQTNLRTGDYPFTGKASKNHHARKLDDPIDVPLYDVQIDHRIVAHNLTKDQAYEFIRSQITIEDVLAAILDAIAEPQFSLDDTLKVLRNPRFFSIAYGATLIRRNPAENQAPIPTPEVYTPKIGKRKIKEQRILDIRVPSIPKEYLEAHDGVTIYDTDSLHIRYSGTKETAAQYLMQLQEQGVKIGIEVRAMPYHKFPAYMEAMLRAGGMVFIHGQRVFCGSPNEIREYLAAGIKAKRFTIKEVIVKRYEPRKDEE